jgi:hypothetical protein
LKIHKARHTLDAQNITGFLIVGDFNFDDINWPDCANVGPGPGYNFIKTLDNNFIYQNVKEKTFQTDDESLTNTLDLILTENVNRIPEISYMPPLGNIKKAHLVLNWRYNLANNIETTKNCFKNTKKII